MDPMPPSRKYNRKEAPQTRTKMRKKYAKPENSQLVAGPDRGAGWVGGQCNFRFSRSRPAARPHITKTVNIAAYLPLIDIVLQCFPTAPVFTFKFLLQID